MVDQVASVSAERFYEGLIDALHAEAAGDRSSFLSDYRDNTRWTTRITGLIQRMCRDTFGLPAADREAWPKVDVSAYDAATDTLWDEWALEIAIEIENDSYSWQNECAKLLLLNCGLKVLITYEGADNLPELDGRLQKFLQIYESRKYGRSEDQWLFVFLPWDSEVESPSTIRGRVCRSSGDGVRRHAALHDLPDRRLIGGIHDSGALG